METLRNINMDANSKCFLLNLKLENTPASSKKKTISQKNLKTYSFTILARLLFTSLQAFRVSKSRLEFFTIQL